MLRRRALEQRMRLLLPVLWFACSQGTKVARTSREAELRCEKVFQRRDALHGVVRLRSSGEIVVGATVQACTAAPADPPYSSDVCDPKTGLVTSMTDENGCYFFPKLPAGINLVTVYYEDWVVSQHVSIDDQVQRADFSIQTRRYSEVVRRAN
jgi:hypothetical protein